MYVNRQSLLRQGTSPSSSRTCTSVARRFVSLVFFLFKQWITTPKKKAKLHVSLHLVTEINVPKDRWKIKFIRRNRQQQWSTRWEGTNTRAKDPRSPYQWQVRGVCATSPYSRHHTAIKDTKRKSLLQMGHRVQAKIMLGHLFNFTRREAGLAWQTADWTLGAARICNRHHRMKPPL